MAKIKDLVGRQFGQLTAQCVHKKSHSAQHTFWECTCQCGGLSIRRSDELTRGLATNCGCKKATNTIIGQRFGRLVVLKRGISRDAKSTSWVCKCDCGQRKTVRRSALIGGKTKSCGCLHREAAALIGAKYGPKCATHKQTKTRTYKTWIAMRHRCENTKSTRYKDYGGRGIMVCDRWKSFENFFADMGERPQGKSIERINNEGHYEPTNCRWATPKEQAQNRRMPRVVARAVKKEQPCHHN